MQEAQEMKVLSWVGKIPWSRKWPPTTVFLLGKFHGKRSLAGSGGCKELDMTEHTLSHSLSLSLWWPVGDLILSIELYLCSSLSFILSWLPSLKQENVRSYIVFIFQLFWLFLLLIILYEFYDQLVHFSNEVIWHCYGECVELIDKIGECCYFNRINLSFMSMDCTSSI